MSDDEQTPDSQLPPFVVCLHCGTQAEPGTQVCPKCGSILLLPKGGTWPPHDQPTPSLGRAADKLDRANEGAGLGLLVGCLGVIGAMIGFIVLTTWLDTLIPRFVSDKLINVFGSIVILSILTSAYFLFSRKVPGFARGFGYMVVIAFAALLGMTAYCTR